MKSIPFILLSIFILSCKQTTTTPTGPKIGEEFELAYAQTIQIQGKTITIKFQNIAEDSRCPTGVICVWEGNAKIILTVAQHDTSVNTTLQPKELTFTGEGGIQYTVRLISVSPYPNINERIKLEEYRIKLVVFSNEVF